MKLVRRQFLHLAAATAVAPALSPMAWAQTYPSRPVRIVVGLAPGGPNDILARLMGQWLTERLGQPFIIDNRAGAGGNIAVEAVVRSSPEGHTLLLGGVANAINATLYEKLNFNFIRDTAPVATIVRQPLVMLLNPSLPAKTIPEFIAFAKANPGKINMASAGTGSAPHVVGELFKMMAGVDMAHVPYRGGGSAMTDVITGQVQVIFIGPAASIEYIRAGTLRALAVTTATRSEVLPDIPPMSDFIPAFEATAWFGIFAPKNTPAEIVDKLNQEINAGLADPKMRTRLAELGGGVFPTAPADFGKLIADETEKWGKVIKFAGMKAS